ncbi:RNA polymerase sigma factor [Mucilaginibacter ximonensis]|uniref:RNA polymerase sigma factor n=1 Tax=Mucilaginibacter ximonensis TaxID=538021 RepID=A0ABW5YFJ9_9SPHI
MNNGLLENLTDQELLTQLTAECSRAAFDVLYNRYWKQVLNQAFKRLGDAEAAQDVAQEVFFQLWKKGTSENLIIGNLGGYLFVSVRNGVLRHFEKASRYESLSDVVSEMEQLHAGADGNLLYQEFLNSFSALINSLPPQQQIIFRLRFDDGLSTQEIAEQLDLSVKTVRNHLGRALATCREALLLQVIISFFLHR